MADRLRFGAGAIAGDDVDVVVDVFVLELLAGGVFRSTIFVLHDPGTETIETLSFTSSEIFFGTKMFAFSGTDFAGVSLFGDSFGGAWGSAILCR